MVRRTLDLLGGQCGEPAFDQVRPRSVGRDEVGVEPAVSQQTFVRRSRQRCASLRRSVITLPVATSSAVNVQGAVAFSWQSLTHDYSRVRHTRHFDRNCADVASRRPRRVRLNRRSRRRPIVRRGARSPCGRLPRGAAPRPRTTTGGRGHRPTWGRAVCALRRGRGPGPCA